MKKFFLCAWLLGVVSQGAFAQTKVSITSNTVDISGVMENGILSRKVYLQNKATPGVKLFNVKTKVIDQLPHNAKASNSFDPDILVGTERKKPIAYIDIPVYKKQGGQIEMLVSYDLEITEQENEGGNTALRPTTVAHSVLASGNWYKIKVPHRGIFKIDYNFLQSIGVNPGNINPANIRLYGNGGTVMPEMLGTEQPDDLIENAIVVNSGGSSFGTSDYVLFYANGPVLWEKDSVNQKFKHVNNYYENYSYYFLNFDIGPGKRIETVTANGASSNIVTSFNDYVVADADSFNVGNIGKIFWSNKMNSVYSPSLTQTLNFNLGELASGPVSMETFVGNVSDNGGNSLNVTITPQGAGAIAGPSFNLNANGDGIIDVASENFNFTPANGNLSVRLKYTPSGEGVAYLDYIRFNYRRQLSFGGGQLNFRDWNSAGLGNANAAFKIQTSNANTKVWEITDPLAPVALNGTFSGSDYTVVREGNRLREFIAYDGSQFFTPGVVTPSLVSNQDLHGLGATDFLIITRNDLLPAAEELAAFHRSKDNMKVTVATIDKIYNEFSSGGQDIAGIRNFIKMFYDRANEEGEGMVKNVLLFGAASFDYKDRLTFNTNVVPTFESLSSFAFIGPYSSDDFFGLLDDGNDYALDVATGRIPAYDLDEATKAVQKIKNYASPNSFGPWKNVISYVADDKDPGGVNTLNHLMDCEDVNVFFKDTDKLYNLYKIYADAHPVVEAAAGSRYPSVNRAINNQIFNGTFLMSYSGHGGPERWADEAILAQDDYGTWNNVNKLPVMVTATCDFGRFDDPAQRSAGAKLMINPTGGSIAMITTTQVVFAYSNKLLNSAYVNKQFLPDASGVYPTLGEALMLAKNAYNGGDNNRKYVVLGDPALKLQMPVHKVRTDKLYMEEDGNTTETDTIRALGRYVLQGSVTDKNDNLKGDFNGEVYVTIFDKMRSVQTTNSRANVSGVTPSFKLQTNVIAKVKGTVTNGEFKVSFIAPKDINYDYGFGKVSYYANTATTDAAGLDTNLTVGGYNPNAQEDNDGPMVEPFIDNDKFRDGGVTGPNPLLYVKLFDDNGINFSGNSIGHDLIAILDEDVANPFVMNEFYETEANDYRRGYVHFPMQNLPDGKHTIRVRAWDVYNNSGEGTVTFEVKNKDNGFISDLYNYPNPVTDITHFVFQHNLKGEKMNINLQIFTAAGRLVKTIKESIQPEGNRTEIQWNGTGEGGQPLDKGVYFYRLNVQTEKGSSAKAYQKLVLLR